MSLDEIEEEKNVLGEEIDKLVKKYNECSEFFDEMEDDFFEFTRMCDRLLSLVKDYREELREKKKITDVNRLYEKGEIEEVSQEALKKYLNKDLAERLVEDKKDELIEMWSEVKNIDFSIADDIETLEYMCEDLLINLKKKKERLLELKSELENMPESPSTAQIPSETSPGSQESLTTSQIPSETSSSGSQESLTALQSSLEASSRDSQEDEWEEQYKRVEKLLNLHIRLVEIIEEPLERIRGILDVTKSIFYVHQAHLDIFMSSDVYERLKPFLIEGDDDLKYI